MSALTARAGRGRRRPAALYELSLAESWGDGVPLLPPTDDAVEALLAARRTRPTTWSARCRRKYGVATVELVAINAAMAGCEPAACRSCSPRSRRCSCPSGTPSA